MKYKVHMVLSKFTWYCQSSHGIVKVHMVLSKSTWYCQSSHGIVKVHMVLSKSTWYCQSPHGIVKVHMVLSKSTWYCQSPHGIVKVHMVLSKSTWYCQSPHGAGSGPSCSKLTTSLVNVSLKFRKLISHLCQYFLLKNCEKLLQCKSFSHFVNKKYQCIWL